MHSNKMTSRLLSPVSRFHRKTFPLAVLELRLRAANLFRRPAEGSDSRHALNGQKGRQGQQLHFFSPLNPKTNRIETFVTRYKRVEETFAENIVVNRQSFFFFILPRRREKCVLVLSGRRGYQQSVYVKQSERMAAAELLLSPLSDRQ
ncbi:hypothetical protein HNY73_021789 [Argiope bruennichi]|uniref:Uncharacterized protein n=1 Tax=Argiope bruennichi TaxID=94029 RepID=A0A8T0E108_ARGBR|nr:hypothetical protein HNY73_021789 [Argiope bruennichi]